MARPRNGSRVGRNRRSLPGRDAFNTFFVSGEAGGEFPEGDREFASDPAATASR
jgi:hypothetical protein